MTLILNIYICVCGSNSLVPSVTSKVPFLTFFALNNKRKRCDLVRSSPNISKSQFVYAYEAKYLILLLLPW